MSGRLGPFINLCAWVPLSAVTGWAALTITLPIDPSSRRTQFVAAALIAAGLLAIFMPRVTGSEHEDLEKRRLPHLFPRLLESAVWGLLGGAVSFILGALVVNSFSVVLVVPGFVVGGLLGFVGESRTALLKAITLVTVPVAVVISGVLIIDIGPLIDAASIWGVVVAGLPAAGLALVAVMVLAARHDGADFRAVMGRRRGDACGTRSRGVLIRRWIVPAAYLALAPVVAPSIDNADFSGSAILAAYLLSVLVLATIALEVVSHLLYGDILIPGLDAADSILDLFLTVLVAFGIAFAVQQYVVKPYRVPSASMERSILIGERVVAARAGFLAGDPKRGEITVFHPNGKGPDVYDAPTASKETFIKRLVGMPGETIGAVNGGVYVCNPGVEITTLPSENAMGCRRLSEPYVSSPQDDFGPVKIPRDRFFMMGDNRADSDDSRSWGPIRDDQFIGPAIFSYWPLDRMGPTGGTPWFGGVKTFGDSVSGGWRTLMAIFLMVVVAAFGVLDFVNDPRIRRTADAE